MPPRTRTYNFAWYIERCNDLQRDLGHVLSDLKFAQETGGTIRYAVDFSEIFAYALPTRTMEEFNIFDDDFKWTDTLHRLALRRISNDLPAKLILLKPYTVETYNFLRHQEEQIFVYIGHIPSIYKEQARLQRSKEFRQIIQLVDTIEHKSYKEKNSIYETIVDFLEKNEMMALLAFLDWEGTTPKQHVIELFRMDRFENLENIINVDENLIMEAEHSWRDWYETMAKQRRSLERQAAASLDATALATVEKVNEVFKNQKGQKRQKLILVTRSQTMHNSAAELSARNPTRHTKDLLRHPRTFSFAINYLPKNTQEDVQERLENVREKVNVFLAELDKHESSDIDENPVVQAQLKELLSKIKEAWRSTVALIASLHEAELHYYDSWEQKQEEFWRVLQLLQENQLQELIVQRLKKCTDNLAHDHLQLGSFLQGADWQQQDFLIDFLVARDYGEGFRLEVSKIPLQRQLPYSLEFHTMEARHLLHDFFFESNDLEARSKPERSEIRSFFQRGLSMRPQYEPLLAMAYILGTLKRWHLAEKYCEWALDVLDEADDFGFEGKFFLSVCIRKQSPSVARHKRAIYLLKETTDLKSIRYGKARPDPRYQKELALHILLLNTDWIEENDGKFPNPDDALKLLNDAYKESFNDDVLRLRVVCDRLYYFVQLGHVLEYKDQVEKDYKELLALQKDIQLEESEWPVFVIDTLAWTSWNLLDFRGKDSASMKDRIIRQLNIV